MELTFIQRRLTSDEINALPLVHYEGPLSVVRSAKHLDEVLPALRAEPILGFDTETRPTFRKGSVHLPSLMQLATADHVYLIQLDMVPLDVLCGELMTNPAQIKAGVAIGEDMRTLGLRFPFTPQGHVDLGTIAEKHNIYSRGLRSLVASFFGERISKGPQCSNWGVSRLSQRQIIYAATDAWMGRRLYMRMLELGLAEAL
ncbi:MAG: 3'-5' exonuclease [Desulfovibrionaceae bacterium]|nr:3'-5' exonuclease [Desulfovibrionaceae bacterium]